MILRLDAIRRGEAVYLPMKCGHSPDSGCINMPLGIRVGHE
ncbi:MAG: hypothetical protein R3E01_12170 [Pirellulaceae bacterium]